VRQGTPKAKSHSEADEWKKTDRIEVDKSPRRLNRVVKRKGRGKKLQKEKEGEAISRERKKKKRGKWKAPQKQAWYYLQ